MAHEIYTDARGAQFIDNDGLPAWHGLGKIRVMAQDFRETVTELLGGASYSIEPLATYYRGSFELVKDQFQVMFRNPNDTDNPVRSFGTVSKDFQILSPDRLSEMLSPVLSDAGYKVATAGLLRNGSSIFVAMDCGERQVVGESYRDYLTFDLSFEPGRTMRVYSTPVRTVCANTQTFGIARASVDCKISHTGNVDGKLAVATALVQNLEDRQIFFANLMERFADYKIHETEMLHVLEQAFPMPVRPKSLASTVDRISPAELAMLADGNEAVMELVQEFDAKERQHINAKARVQQARELATFAHGRFEVEFPEFAGTAYALYNAITETADWRDGKGNIGESALVGTRMREKVRAADALINIVGADA